jgi:hypothetical protein
MYLLKFRSVFVIHCSCDVNGVLSGRLARLRLRPSRGHMLTELCFSALKCRLRLAMGLNPHARVAEGAEAD